MPKLSHRDREEPNTFGNLYLLSASYIRVGKWSDTRRERLSWQNTYLWNVINSIESADKGGDEMLKMLYDHNMFLLKFGTYGRGSKIIPILREKFPIKKS